MKLGTMGEYGTPNIDIEEGFLEIEHNGPHRQPAVPQGAPAASTTSQGRTTPHNIHFACRVYGLRATDLNQGVVYGVHTDETLLDERLLTRFDVRRASSAPRSTGSACRRWSASR